MPRRQAQQQLHQLPSAPLNRSPSMYCWLNTQIRAFHIYPGALHAVRTCTSASGSTHMGRPVGVTPCCVAKRISSCVNCTLLSSAPDLKPVAVSRSGLMPLLLLKLWLSKDTRPLMVAADSMASGFAEGWDTSTRRTVWPASARIQALIVDRRSQQHYHSVIVLLMVCLYNLLGHAAIAAG